MLKKNIIHDVRKLQRQNTERSKKSESAVKYHQKDQAEISEGGEHAGKPIQRNGESANHKIIPSKINCFQQNKRGKKIQKNNQNITAFGRIAFAPGNGLKGILYRSFVVFPCVFHPISASEY